MSGAAAKKPATSFAPTMKKEEKPALRVERVQWSDAIKEAIRVNLHIAKDAAAKKRG